MTAIFKTKFINKIFENFKNEKKAFSKLKWEADIEEERILEKSKQWQDVQQ